VVPLRPVRSGTTAAGGYELVHADGQVDEQPSEVSQLSLCEHESSSTIVIGRSNQSSGTESGTPATGTTAI